MARNFRTFAWMMTSLVALAGTATAGASLVGGLDASVTSDHGLAGASSDLGANYADGELPAVDGALDANAEARGHDASVHVDVDEQRAVVTVDDTTISTDVIGAVDVPSVPDAPEVDGSFEFSAMIDAMVDAGEGLLVTLSAAVTAFLEW